MLLSSRHWFSAGLGSGGKHSVPKIVKMLRVDQLYVLRLVRDKMEPFQYGRFLDFFVNCERKALKKKSDSTGVKTKKKDTSKIEDETSSNKAPLKSAKKSSKRNPKKSKRNTKRE